MDDLISRSKAVQLLRGYADTKCETGEIELANGILKAVCFIEKKENIPTAYNVDKVVEQLVELQKHGDFCQSEDDTDCVLNKTCGDCYTDKIREIVKAGGVNG